MLLLCHSATISTSPRKVQKAQTLQFRSSTTAFSPRINCGWQIPYKFLGVCFEDWFAQHQLPTGVWDKNTYRHSCAGEQVRDFPLRTQEVKKKI